MYFSPGPHFRDFFILLTEFGDFIYTDDQGGPNLTITFLTADLETEVTIMVLRIAHK